MLSKQLKDIYKILFKRFGPQDWWPGDTPFEVIVGAILTQNTNWTNVEKAIANLKKARVLTPEKLYRLDIGKLTQLIRPAGYYNIKASRVKNFLDWLFINHAGNLALANNLPSDCLRDELLSVDGIGPETADSILLYAFERPVFVVDAYTIRICLRHHLIEKNAKYAQVKNLFESNLPASRSRKGCLTAKGRLTADVQLFNEYHALLVRLGKDFCRPKPWCPDCPLNHLPHTITSLSPSGK
jgi:endonuclease-3 related protein